MPQHLRSGGSEDSGCTKETSVVGSRRMDSELKIRARLRLSGASMNTPDESLLKLDYEKTLEAVDKFDNYLLQIKSWSVVFCGAVLAYGVDKKSIAVTTATIILAICFFVVACIYKTFQIDAMNHAYALETLLRPGHPERAKFEVGYQFGVGHAIKALTHAALDKTMGHPSLWHLRAFFALIICLAVAADVWIWRTERNHPLKPITGLTSAPAPPTNPPPRL